MVAAWDIYARQLLPLGYGHPLWGPEPCPKFGEVHLGDVGYLRDGHFCFLFNAMRDADDPLNSPGGVPQGFVKFCPPERTLISRPNEITQPHLHSKNLQCISISAGASTSEMAVSASAGLRYHCNEDSGALLILKRPAHKTYLDCKMRIRPYLQAHLASWCEFANIYLGIGLDEKDIIFVSGFTKTSLWAEAAFSNSSSNGELVVAGGVPAASGEFHVSVSRCIDSSVFSRTGPIERTSAWKDDYSTLLDIADQCVFLNYYKMKSRGILRRPIAMRAAAGPHRLPSDSDDEPPSSAQSPSACSDASFEVFKDYDPVNTLLDYILKHSDAEIACASDSDLLSLFKDQTLPEDLESELEQLAPPVLLDESHSGVIAVPPNSVRATMHVSHCPEFFLQSTTTTNDDLASTFEQLVPVDCPSKFQPSDPIKCDGVANLQPSQSPMSSSSTIPSVIAAPLINSSLIPKTHEPQYPKVRVSDWASMSLSTFGKISVGFLSGNPLGASEQKLLDKGKALDAGASYPETSPTRDGLVGMASSSTNVSLTNILSGRKCYRAAEGYEDVWPPHLEEALLEGCNSDVASATDAFRDNAIAEHILKTTGVVRTAKQVASRIQCLRSTTETTELMGMINAGLAFEPLPRDPSASPQLSMNHAAAAETLDPKHDIAGDAYPGGPSLDGQLDMNTPAIDEMDNHALHPPAELSPPAALPASCTPSLANIDMERSSPDDPPLHFLFFDEGSQDGDEDQYSELVTPPNSNDFLKKDFLFKDSPLFADCDVSRLASFPYMFPIDDYMDMDMELERELPRCARTMDAPAAALQPSPPGGSDPEPLSWWDAAAQSSHTIGVPPTPGLDGVDGDKQEEATTARSDPDAIAAKRTQNTLAARKSRKRKLEYQMELEATIEREREEKAQLKVRVRKLEELLVHHGHQVPPSGEAERGAVKRSDLNLSVQSLGVPL